MTLLPERRGSRRTEAGFLGRSTGREFSPSALGRGSSNRSELPGEAVEATTSTLPRHNPLLIQCLTWRARNPRGALGWWVASFAGTPLGGLAWEAATIVKEAGL